jgi:hypothetical protein
MRTFTLILLSLCSALFLQAADPILTQERPISPPVSGPTSPSQGDVQIASSGHGALLTWFDTRGYPSGIGNTSYHQPELLAARVDAEGNLLDSPNLVLPLSGSPIPLWNGTNYLVIDPASYVRISPDGTLLDPSPRPYAAPASKSGLLLGAAVALRSRRIVVYSEDYGGGLFLWIYDLDLNLLRTIHTTGSGVSQSLASNGENFLLVEPSGFALVGMLIAPDGTLTPTAPILSSSPGFAFVAKSVISDGDRYLILARQSDYVSPYGHIDQYLGAIIDPNGAPRAIIPPFGSVASYIEGMPDPVWNGQEYQFVSRFENPNQNIPSFPAVVAYRIDTAGNHGDGINLDGVPPPQYGQAGLVLGSTGSTSVLAWFDELTQTQGGLTRFHIQPFSSIDTFAATASRAFPLGHGSFAQERPFAASNANATFAVWRERVDPTQPLVVMATRLATNGAAAGDSVRLSDTTCDGTTAAVATDGQSAVVVWQQLDGVRVAHLAGDPLSATGATLFRNQFNDGCHAASPAIAWNGSEYLAVWKGTDGINTGLNMYAMRVARDGSPIDALPIVLAAPTDGVEPHVASNGQDFVVAWNGNPRKFNATALAVTAGGTAKPLQTVALNAPTVGALFWNGRSYVVVSPTATGGSQLTRVGPDGHWSDLERNFAATLGPTYPVYGPSQSGVLCANGACWSVGGVSPTMDSPHLDIYLSQIIDDGTKFTVPPPTLVLGTTRSAYDFVPPLFALARVGSQPVVLQQRLAAEAPYAGVSRVFVKTVPLRERPSRK